MNRVVPGAGVRNHRVVAAGAQQAERVGRPGLPAVFRPVGGEGRPDPGIFHTGGGLRLPRPYSGLLRQTARHIGDGKGRQRDEHRRAGGSRGDPRPDGLLIFWKESFAGGVAAHDVRLFGQRQPDVAAQALLPALFIRHVFPFFRLYPIARNTV